MPFSSVSEFRKAVIERAQRQPAETRLIGELREDVVANVLQLFKDRGLIRSYVATGAFSWADLIDGIDFYAVVVKGKYIQVPISVTGPRLVREHLKKHPDVPVIAVDLHFGLEKAKARAAKKVLRIIKAAR